MKTLMLSPFEKACLLWVSRGKSVTEIASLEHKTVAEIERNLENVLVALEATSLQEALAKVQQTNAD